MTLILPGVQKSISSNLYAKIHMKVFEVSNAVLEKKDFYGVIQLSTLSLMLESFGFKNYKDIIMNEEIQNIYLANQYI